MPQLASRCEDNPSHGKSAGDGDRHSSLWETPNLTAAFEKSPRKATDMRLPKKLVRPKAVR